MPIPVAMKPNANNLVASLVHLAHAVGGIKTQGGGGGPAATNADLSTIAGHFSTIATTLDAGNAAGAVSPAQIATIKTELQAIVDLL